MALALTRNFLEWGTGSITNYYYGVLRTTTSISPQSVDPQSPSVLGPKAREWSIPLHPASWQATDTLRISSLVSGESTRALASAWYWQEMRQLISISVSVTSLSVHILSYFYFFLLLLCLLPSFLDARKFPRLPAQPASFLQRDARSESEAGFFSYHPLWTFSGPPTSAAQTKDHLKLTCVGGE